MSDQQQVWDQLRQAALEDDEHDRLCREAMGEEAWKRYCDETDALLELIYFEARGGKLC